jgi:hypothetical protein
METLTQYRIVRKLGRYAIEKKSRWSFPKPNDWVFAEESGPNRWRESKQATEAVIKTWHNRERAVRNWKQSPTTVIEYYPPLI